MSQPNQTIYRTSPARVGKMMAIMLGICIVGGAIFFGMWDYWISQVPPVVANTSVDIQGEVIGKTIKQSLSFVESEDLRTLAFNALPGEEGNNPTIDAIVGDEIIFDVVNDGMSLHAFGVTQDEEGFGGIIIGTEIASVSNALKSGEGGTSTFVPSATGQYYYICTVPGHREQGMVGTIIVGEEELAAAPTGTSHDFTVDFVESEDFRTLAFNALPGEENHNPDFVVASGDEVTFTAINAGVSFHSFGITTDQTQISNILWGSEIAAPTKPLNPGESGSTTFVAGAPGQYYYICTVPGHALQGMVGSFTVE